MAPPPFSRADTIALLQFCENGKQLYRQCQSVLNANQFYSEASQLDGPIDQLDQIIKDVVRNYGLP